MHRCSVDFRALPVCRTFVVLCNKMWFACVLCVAQRSPPGEKKHGAAVSGLPCRWPQAKPAGCSAFDAADLDGAFRNLVIRCQLVRSRVFNGFAFAHDEVAGTRVVLRNAGAVLSDAIVNLDVHGCSRFMDAFLILRAEYSWYLLRCNIGFPQVLHLLARPKTPMHVVAGRGGLAAALRFACMLGLSV